MVTDGDSHHLKQIDGTAQRKILHVHAGEEHSQTGDMHEDKDRIPWPIMGRGGGYLLCGNDGNLCRQIHGKRFQVNSFVAKHSSILDHLLDSFPLVPWFMASSWVNGVPEATFNRFSPLFNGRTC